MSRWRSRHAADRDQQERGRGREAPDDHFRCAGAARCAPLRSIGSDSRRSRRPVAGRGPRAAPAPGCRPGRCAARVRRRAVLEPVVAPFGQHAVRRAEDAQRVRRELDRDVAARAGHAVEEDGCPEIVIMRSILDHNPPTPSASARPSPTDEPASPAAETCSSTAGLLRVERFRHAPPQAEPDRRLVDGRIAQRNRDVGAEARDRGDDLLALESMLARELLEAEQPRRPTTPATSVNRNAYQRKRA